MAFRNLENKPVFEYHGQALSSGTIKGVLKLIFSQKEISLIFENVEIWPLFTV